MSRGRCAGSECRSWRARDQRGDSDAGGGDNTLRCNREQMAGTTGCRQQRGEREAVGAQFPVRIALISCDGVCAKVGISMSLSTKLRDEQRHRHHQCDAQIGCLTQSFQRAVLTAYALILTSAWRNGQLYPCPVSFFDNSPGGRDHRMAALAAQPLIGSVRSGSWVTPMRHRSRVLLLRARAHIDLELKTAGAFWVAMIA
jgi:hypothetical protein